MDAPHGGSFFYLAGHKTPVDSKEMEETAIAGDGRIGQSRNVPLPATNAGPKPRSVESLVTPGSNGVIREVTKSSGPALEKRINRQFVDAVLLSHPKDPKKSIQVLGNFDDVKVPKKGETILYQGKPVTVLKQKTEINTLNDLENLERTAIKEGFGSNFL
jgi:hypothetical protein